MLTSPAFRSQDKSRRKDCFAFLFCLESTPKGAQGPLLIALDGQCRDWTQNSCVKPVLWLFDLSPETLLRLWQGRYRISCSAFYQFLYYLVFRNFVLVAGPPHSETEKSVCLPVTWSEPASPPSAPFYCMWCISKANSFIVQAPAI